MAIEHIGQKKLLQEIPYGLDGLVIDLAAECPAIAFACYKPGVLELLKMVRDRRPGQFHAIADMRKGLLYDPCPGTARLPFFCLKFGSPLLVLRIAALLIDHQKDLEPLLA
jgi:hypothetical protein